MGVLPVVSRTPRDRGGGWVGPRGNGRPLFPLLRRGPLRRRGPAPLEPGPPEPPGRRRLRLLHLSLLLLRVRVRVRAVPAVVVVPDPFPHCSLEAPVGTQGVSLGGRTHRPPSPRPYSLTSTLCRDRIRTPSNPGSGRVRPSTPRSTVPVERPPSKVDPRGSEPRVKTRREVTDTLEIVLGGEEARTQRKRDVGRQPYLQKGSWTVPGRC